MKPGEFYVVTVSFAAPFISEQDAYYQEAGSPEEAITAVRQKYSHPAGLYAAIAYDSDSPRDQKPLARWLCNHEIAKEAATKGRGSFMYRGVGPGEFEIDGKLIKVTDPRGGGFVPVR